ncbi:TatD family hydrolase [Candidatus Dependentiae bacterium]|nr:TatD family hydrolase [Candidatus Dependentiae bacterium]
MLIDTHCHINIMTKESFDTVLLPHDYQLAQQIIADAKKEEVFIIFNVGTSLIESINCIELAKKFPEIYAVVGIHPNDLSHEWRSDIAQLKKFIIAKNENKIVAIGECGLDFHYPDYDLTRQQDAFKVQIELALEHDLPLVIHTRDAGDETLRALETFKDSNLRGVIHCFSEGLVFAQDAINLGFVLGIGGTITYPKNTHLRQVVTTVGLDHIILETDAPYLPPQSLRGKKNSPKNIRVIANYIAELLETDLQTVADATTNTVKKIFKYQDSK